MNKFKKNNCRYLCIDSILVILSVPLRYFTEEFFEVGVIINSG